MIVRVQLFAGARDRAGRGVVELDLPEDATVRLLRERLMAELPQLADLLGRALLAVDHDYAEDEDRLQATSEVAIIPPVSGG